MKRYFLFAVMAVRVFAAGSVSQSIAQLGNSPSYVITVNWTGDASTGSVPVTAITGGSSSEQQKLLNGLQGYIFTTVSTSPGSPAPTNTYSLTIKDTSGLDILQAEATSLSSTLPQVFGVPASSPPLNSTFTINITNQSVASARGTIYIYMTKASVVAIGSSGGGGSGITQLTGDGTAGPGTGSQALTLATVNTDTSACGDSTHVCQVTANGKGLVTSATPVAISGGGGGSPAGSNGDIQINSTGSFGAGNINQQSDGSLLASKAVDWATCSTPTFNSGGTTNWNLASSNCAVVTFTGTATTLSVTGEHGAGTFKLITVNNGSGNGVYTAFPGTFVGAAQPFGIAGKTTIQDFTFIGSNYLGQAATCPDCTTPGISIPGTVSGASTIVAPATGGGTATLFAGSDTVVGKATTDILTNKAFDTAGTGNSFAINGTAITAVSGSGAVCLVSGSACASGAASYNCAPSSLGPGICKATISSAQILALGTGGNAIPLITAAGANTYIEVTSVLAKYNFVTAAYGGSGMLGICFDTTSGCAGAGGSMNDSAQTFAPILAKTSSQTERLVGNNQWLVAGSEASTGTINKGIYLVNWGSAFTTGAGNLVIDIAYIVHTGF